MIYLDHNATTPMHPRVFRAIEPYLKERFGNASSSYQTGREARTALENSRTTVAGCIGAGPKEIIFTSGGTESNNCAVRGVARALGEKGDHIITSSIEHHAVLKTCQALEKEGFRVTYLPVGSDGRVDPDDVRKNLDQRTILISIMYANNETGVIQPIREIASIAREKNIIFHTDAVQAVGKIPFAVNDLGVDLLSISGHKIYGPKGIGALYVREGIPLQPILTGGHHEHNLRAGTENIPSIVGLAQAMSMATQHLNAASDKLSALRQRLESGILNRIDDVQINGLQAPRLPNTSSISFRLIEGESILLHLDLRGICVSTGSACTTDSPEPSHVLTAMGILPQAAQGTIRFSLGEDNTKEEIDSVIDALCDITTRLRNISSLAGK
jgi:cysteine desulfurase